MNTHLQHTHSFDRNDPYSRDVEWLTPQRLSSSTYMQSIRAFVVPPDGFAIWFLGQNGFLLKEASGLLVGIDLYLTDSCADLAREDGFRLHRQLPIFIEPEDLEVDVFATTHSHQDHADPETIRRIRKDRNILFLGPYESQHVYQAAGVPQERCRVLHPGETLPLGNVKIQATFALPTDATDLNHTGLLMTFQNETTFYNTGDTAWFERLPSLLPHGVDVCAVCINGGYGNLGAEQAAALVTAIAPRVAIPSHYDMMVNNVGSPRMFRVALERLGSTAEFHQLPYYEAWVYTRREQNHAIK